MQIMHWIGVKCDAIHEQWVEIESISFWYAWICRVKNIVLFFSFIYFFVCILMLSPVPLFCWVDSTKIVRSECVCRVEKKYFNEMLIKKNVWKKERSKEKIIVGILSILINMLTYWFLLKDSQFEWVFLLTM